MSINGIPIILGEGEERESVVFASARKCPALLNLLKKLNAADLAETKAARLASEAESKMQDCSVDDLDEAEAAAVKAADAAQDASMAVFKAVRAFIVKGFTGAGYTPEDANRLADKVPPEGLAELRGKCLMGSGRMDFSKA